MLLLLAMLYFNSIKVQLRREALRGQRGKTPRFQFHKGTIKTNGFTY